LVEDGVGEIESAALVIAFVFLLGFVRGGFFFVGFFGGVGEEGGVVVGEVAVESALTGEVLLIEDLFFCGERGHVVVAE
jgi:hypothetical protein